MLTYLKVKIKSLAAEARIIRKEELKNKGNYSWKADLLREHRRGDVRREARSAHIAYGLLRGNKLTDMERISYSAPDYKRIKTLISKYGGLDTKHALESLQAFQTSEELKILQQANPKAMEQKVANLGENSVAQKILSYLGV